MQRSYLRSQERRGGFGSAEQFLESGPLLKPACLIVGVRMPAPAPDDWYSGALGIQLRLAIPACILEQ